MTIREFAMEQLNLQVQNISKKSVLECKQKLELSDVTMNKYLAGNGSKIDVYESIINFFKNYHNGNQ